ncbi:MAG: arginine decarboxylase, pyruvoyl-dependent [Planctomycetes bacterium GWA2_40_7]|nr:MAG: arginine decarboxylase, pyruvoyl-dependent [Planctomycetes bacterium GWA2_40_7]OHB47239.1 MAG: arginine decarboxylase, pyruvoyl-dependent [Planctomycetes bacterium GWF2_40_8]OHB90683.1 MAG: arginine decarboxylase, pyruvoyl-dependent [Planctomycetes bacterium RIFCSPHIGHO2_02_FULL_40_12]OHC02100.1 MAG: arginine decarboxylase, pyruvoyl-dependent [Planctomycetes bacterium RIFCSPLOWO2_12_FULL_40_19]
MVPKQIFFTKGAGRHKHKLQSFELALRRAYIEKFNLVKVSSIFPPNCKIITKRKGVKEMRVGQVAFCVLSENSTNEPNRLISASIGLAVPSEKDHYGYLSEHHAYGDTKEKSGDYAEDLAATMLAGTLGIEFDPEKNYDERKEIYLMSGKIVKTRNITQAARGDKYGLWTTVVAAAVFIL